MKKPGRVHWSREQYREHMQKFHPGFDVSPADVEQNIGDEAAIPVAPQKVDTPVRVRVHSKRKRLCDSDGICAKFAVDAIVRAGILPDDSPEFVHAVTFSQEKCPTEVTIITVETVSEEAAEE